MTQIKTRTKGRGSIRAWWAIMAKDAASGLTINSQSHKLEAPNFHDGSLDGVFTIGDVLYVFLSIVPGESFTIICRGVTRARVDDFRQGNIVLRIEVRTGAECVREEIQWVYGLGGTGPKEEQYLENAVRKVHLENLILLMIEPSYGATTAVLCSRIECVPGVQLPARG